ncbi:uncharacterized protein [Venturia canescens]|uniref:uncharacterized protein n=1 Tax=Venturia canescens TaxID=32260 RepID=UPI001C9C5E25|nr:uncharacterized protein LOC122407340 [Venturia canescens]
MPYNARAVVGKKKGKFVKEKVKRAIEAVKNNLYRHTENKYDDSVKSNLEGRRIVELKTLGLQLWCQYCDLALSLRDVTDEQRCGFASVLRVACNHCGKIIMVHTNIRNSQTKCHDVNLKAAIAIIDSGIGESQMNTICSAMNIPSVSAKLLKRSERIVGSSIETVAKESCKNSIKLEKQLSVDRDQVQNNESADPIPTKPESSESISDTIENRSPEKSPETNIIASIDTGWQKRGTGHAYNSNSGLCDKGPEYQFSLAMTIRALLQQFVEKLED